MDNVEKKVINVTRSSMPDFEDYCNEIKDIWESRWLTNSGVKYQKLCAGLKKYLGVENVSLFVNGHLALENIIEAMGFEKGSEIITTPFTFASTTNAIIRCGHIPVFCDINMTDYTIDVKKIEALITEKTVAVIPVHVYGNICDVEALDKIAKKHGLKVIYDAAHAFGVKYKGQSVLNYGDASMLSFHATKVFNTIEGGALIFKNADLEAKLNSMKNFGLTGPDSQKYVGGNAKLNEFAAAMGVCNLKNIDTSIAKRKIATEQYRKRLSGVKGIVICDEQNDVVHNYAYMPALFDGYKYNRDEIVELLAKDNIHARKYFYPLTGQVEGVKEYCAVQKTPHAEFVTENILCLPIYEDLTVSDVDRICDIILGG